MISVDRALQTILARAKPTETETVPIAEAFDRTLADGITAVRDQPPFPASAMDGYALRTADVADGRADLRIIGESAAGHPFDGTLEAGTCIRIFTGAVVPPGADTIAIQENAVRDSNHVAIAKAERLGRYIRPAAGDFAAGDTLARAGDRLTPARLSLMAAANRAELKVHRRPRVGIIASGDELTLPGELQSAGGVVSSNHLGVAAQVRRAGGEAFDAGIARDTASAIKAAVERCAHCDVIVTLGGASVGTHDLIRPTLLDLGWAMDFWKVAMRPGKPLTFGHRGDMLMLGLPGNPVSSLVCAEIFLVPLIAEMMGSDPISRITQATLGVDLPANDQREEYMRARLIDGRIVPVDSQDSSLLTRLVDADGLLRRPVDAPPARAGEPCDFISLNG